MNRAEPLSPALLQAAAFPHKLILQQLLLLSNKYLFLLAEYLDHSISDLHDNDHHDRKHEDGRKHCDCE